MRYPWAVPGRKVVCVDDSWSDRACRSLGIEPPSRVPMLNEVLTIREVWEGHFAKQVVLSFQELGHDFGFCASSFRPLHTIEDDVALFAELLTPAPNAPMLPDSIIKEPTGT